MTRFVMYWCLLVVTALAGTAGTSVLLFRHLDVTYTAFATLLMAPAAQALLLTWDVSPPSGLRGALRAAAHAPLARPVLLLDALFAGAGLLAWTHPIVGFGGAVTQQPVWVATKSAAAAVALLVWNRRPWPRRAAMAAGAASLALLAVVPWITAARRLVVLELHVPAIVSRMLVDGGVLAAAVWLLESSAHAEQHARPHAATLYRVASACLVAAGLVDALATFNLAVLTQPWLGLLTLAASAAATALLLSSILATPAAPEAG